MVVELRGEGGKIKKDSHKAMCRNSTKDNKIGYKNKE